MFSCRIREYDNFEAYKKAGLYVSYVTPEEISSFKGVSRHIGPMGGMDAYSICVTDEQYEEIYFSPTGTGGIEQGVFFFPGTNTMIFYRTKSR